MMKALKIFATIILLLLAFFIFRAVIITIL